METRSADRLIVRIRRKLAHATLAYMNASTEKARARHARRVRQFAQAERQLARDIARNLALSTDWSA